MSDERKRILARLAAERAHLLYQLIGIDPQTLKTVPVFADWTAVHLLAHIADYDSLHSARLRLVLEHRAHEIASIGDDTPDPLAARNAQLRAQFADCTLEQVLAALAEARRDFLAHLAHFDDSALRSERRFLWGYDTAYKWTGSRWMHDSHHADDLRRWRKTLADTEAIGAPALLLHTLAAAQADFAASAALVTPPEASTRRICGAWTLKDVYGHLADWNRYFIWRASLFLNLPHSAPDWEETESINARRLQPLPQVMADEAATRAQFEALLAAASAEEFTRSSADLDSPYRGLYDVGWSALEHYLDHAAALRRALGMDMPGRLLMFAGRYTCPAVCGIYFPRRDDSGLAPTDQ
ncbi:MAG: DinB family protein [Chloroflexi bacterium]|nr:DinB family protein [Chloroflexota bacterium]